jgi:AcrR family transcriptional regulator
MASEKASAKKLRPRVPRQERGRARVAALMAAAADLFADKGFAATTMTEIAARAGAAIGTLYLFFPTKDALAQAILADHADELSAMLDRLQAKCRGEPASAIAERLFSELGEFVARHPAYSALLDLPGDGAWRRDTRARRRQQIAALFAGAVPAVPAARAERLAVIVPQLMRIPITMSGERLMREAVLEELRLMLMRHLALES